MNTGNRTIYPLQPINNFIHRFLLLIFVLLPSQYIFSQQNNLGTNFKISAHPGFVENRGQVKNQFKQHNTAVKYLLQANGMNVQLRQNGFSYDTYQVLSAPSSISRQHLADQNIIQRDSASFRFHRIDIQFPGSNLAPQIIAEEQSADYFIHVSPGAKDTKVYHYKKVIYKELYPGIDLIFDTRNAKGERAFEYYFIVKPGADANKIRIKYSGGSTNLIDHKIVIATSNGKLAEHIPASYLSIGKAVDINNLSLNPGIHVGYIKIATGLYGFSVPAYDKTKTLIIDPTPELVWGTYYGGSINDWAQCITKDSGGNIFVGGASSNPNLATAGAFQTNLVGYSDAMIGKFASDGTLMWMTYFGGEQDEDVLGICCDNEDNVLVVGLTQSKTGIADASSFQPEQGDTAYGADGFIAKFTNAGSRVWSTYFGGLDVDYLHGVKVDASGNVFVAGWTHSTSNISTAGSYQQTYGNNIAEPLNPGDGVIARFTKNGQRVWATYYGGLSFDRFYGLALDSRGDIYATGIAYSTGLSSPGAFQTNQGGGLYDALLVKFDSTGNRKWATYYGGNSEDNALSITCDNQNNVAIAGMTISTSNIATAGTYLPSFSEGTRDGFVAKFDANGNRLWGTYYGGNGEEMIYGITSDVNNNLLIVGSTYSTNNIASSGSLQPVFPGSGALWTPFIAKLGATGNRLWGTYFGSGSFYGNGDAKGAVADSNGNVFVCGYTMAPNQIATCNAVQQTWAGNGDIFVAMFSETVDASTVSVLINSTGNGTVCPGEPMTFTAAVLNGGSNPFFQWKVNGINAGTNTASLTISTLNNGDSVSCAVISSSPCVNTATAISNTITATILPAVIPAVTINSSAPGIICTGSAVTFTATPVNGGSTPFYQWKINGNSVGANAPIFSVNTLSNGDVVHCELTNPRSCNAVNTANSNSIAMQVSNTVTPAITISSAVTGVCAGQPVTLNAMVSNAGSTPTFQWTVNGAAVGTGPGYTTSLLHNTDTVQCILTPGSTACAGSGNVLSNKISIPIYPLPDFTFELTNPVISKGDSVQLSVMGSNITRYQWTPALNISNDRVSNPVVWPGITQSYTLETTSLNGCRVSKQVLVSVITEIFIPTAFSPDNNLVNDYWVIKGLELYPDCVVTVYSRWGQIVFQSKGYSNPWDGKFKGQSLPTGTFTYIINFRNGKRSLVGTVTIVR